MILYEDRYVVCDDDAITIHAYYFPVGSKRIPYTTMVSVTEENIDFWTGAGRIWGMGISPHWFHLDWDRPGKTRCIIINDGFWVKSVVTPDNHDRVMEILAAKVSI